MEKLPSELLFRIFRLSLGAQVENPPHCRVLCAYYAYLSVICKHWAIVLRPLLYFFPYVTTANGSAKALLRTLRGEPVLGELVRGLSLTTSRIENETRAGAAEEVLMSLVLRCENLEHLTLREGSLNFFQILVFAPNLRYLSCEGTFFISSELPLFPITSNLEVLHLKDHKPNFGRAARFVSFPQLRHLYSKPRSFETSQTEAFCLSLENVRNLEIHYEGFDHQFKKLLATCKELDRLSLSMNMWHFTLDKILSKLSHTRAHTLVLKDMYSLDSLKKLLDRHQDGIVKDLQALRAERSPREMNWYKSSDLAEQRKELEDLEHECKKRGIELVIHTNSLYFDPPVDDFWDLVPNEMRRITLPGRVWV